MINYEVMFIIDPMLDDEKKDAAVERVKNVIAAEGEVGNVDVWGLRKLAYPIQNKKSGFYHLFEFKVAGEAIEPFELEFRRDERVMRYLTVKLDKHAIAWAEKRRAKLNTKKA